MSAEAEQEENHWPGFVDALSTIVMVVTFLLIILAIAIFAMSLNIAKVALETPPEELSTNLDYSKSVAVESKPVEMAVDAGATPRFRSENVLRLQFSGTTIEIDDVARGEVASFFARHGDKLDTTTVEVSAYYDASGDSYTKQRRISYYRLMAVRNVLMMNGFDAERLRVYVREAPSADRIDTVEIYGTNG